MTQTLEVRNNYWLVAKQLNKTVTLDVAAKRLHSHPNTVRRWILMGRLKGIKCNGKWYVLL